MISMMMTVADKKRFDHKRLIFLDFSPPPPSSLEPILYLLLVLGSPLCFYLDFGFTAIYIIGRTCVSSLSGWAGKGSALRHGAIAKPITLTQKKTLAGVGKDRDEAIPFWDQ